MRISDWSSDVCSSDLDDGDREGSVEADARIDPDDDREADRLRDQGERDDDAGKRVGADIGKPVAFDRGGVEHDVGSIFDRHRPHRLLLPGVGRTWRSDSDRKSQSLNSSHQCAYRKTFYG